MNLKTLSFTTLTLAAALLPADAYFRAALEITKEYRQGPSGVPTFRNGQAYLYVVDGIITVTGCARNGQNTPFGISTILGCNIGSNGVSFDGDGTPTPEFKEIVGLESATTVEPGRHDLISLYARPAYDFPVNGLNITSLATEVFYDLLSQAGDIREYRLAGRGLAGGFFIPGYSMLRNYGPSERSRMEKEIVPGNYQFKFPSLGRPAYPLYLNFPVRATVEGYTDKYIKQGFRFTNVGPFTTGTSPAGIEAGFAQYDADLISTFTWEGLVPGVVSNGDRLYIGFRPLFDETDPDSPLLTAPSGNPNIPPYPVYSFPPAAGIPTTGRPFYGTRILLPSPVQNSYNLPSGFYGPNRKAVLELTLERDPQAGLAAVNSRVFQLPIVFVSTLPGVLAKAFPKNTDPALLTKDADPDGDGQSNWLEWLSGTDPSKANAPAALSQLAFVPASTRRSGQTIPGYWFMEIPRRAGLPSGVEVTVESSTDLTNWSKVPDNDPHWIVEDIRSEPRVRILSRTPELTEQGRTFRIRYSDPG